MTTGTIPRRLPACSTGLPKNRAWASYTPTTSALTNVTRRLGVLRPGLPRTFWIKNLIGPCFLYRRQVFSELQGYDESLFGPDYDFWLRAALWFKFTRLPQPLYYYRSHGKSLTSRKYRLIASNVEKAVRRWLPQVTWASESARVQAYIEWGVRCLRADTWKDVYEPWLQQATWLDAEKRAWMRREVLQRTIELAWEALAGKTGMTSSDTNRTCWK